MTRCLTLMMLLLFGTMNKAAAEDLPAVKYMAYDTSTGEMVEKTLAAGSYIPVTQTAANVMVALAESQEAEEVELNPGWYVVSGTVNFSKGLALAPSTASAPIGARRKGVTSTSNEVNIILTDGCKLTVNGSLIFYEGKAITLNIYAQSGNTGTAKFIPAPAPNDDMKLLFISENGSMNVHGGNIEAKIRIMCGGALNIYSGTLNAQFDGGTDDTAPSFGDKASINLSWARGTESYKSDSYPTNVTLLKPFYVDGTTPVGATATNITGKTIKPGIVKTLAAAATTWYNDSDYDWALPTGLTAYAVTAFDETKAASAAVTTTALTYISAKTGVLLEGAKGDYALTPYFGTKSTVASLLKTGTPTAYKDYIYDGSDFVLYSGTEALADGKCYLPGTAAKTVTGTTVDAVKIVTPTGGTITAAQSSTTVTLTATPSVGYFITAADIVVTKTAPNGKALARGLAEKLAVTAGTVDATGKGTYTFTLPAGYGAVVEATFTEQMDIKNATVTLDWTEKEYKPGTVQKAAVTKVTLNDTDLSATDDYGVTYQETKWIDHGTYTINVTGKGKYKGTATTTFRINALKVAAVGTGANQIAVVFKGTNSSSITYDGAAHGVDFMVGGKAAAVEDVIATITDAKGNVVSECTNAGIYGVKVEDGASGNIVLPDDVTISDKVTIDQKSVSTTATGGAGTLTITLTPTEATYTGGDLTPTVTVKDGETTINASEYTVAFTLNGAAVEKCINAGTYTVTLTDKEGGNYTVSGSTTFTIAPLTITDFKLTGIPEGGFVYDGTPKTVGVAYNNGTNDVTIDASEYTMTYKLGTAAATELKAAGTYTVTLTDKEGGNYTISGSKELTIAPKPVNTTGEGGAATLTITLSPTGATYTGGDLTPTVTVKDGETSIDKSEYTVAFTLNGTAVEKCINIGNYTVTITDKEGGNYTVSGTAMFTISPPSFTDESGVIFHYEELTDGTIKIISVKVPKGVTDVNIPATIGSKKVSAIGKDAFKGNTGVVNITIPTTAKPLTIDKSAFTTGEGGDKEPDVIVPSGMADKYAGQLLEEIGPNLVTLLNFVADHKYKTVSSAYSILIPVAAGIDVYKVVGNYIGNDSKLTSVALKAYQNLQKVTVKGVQYYRLDPTAFTSIATTRAGEPVDPLKRAVRCVIGRGPSFASAAHDPAIAVYRPYAPSAPIFKSRLVPVKAHAIGARKAVNEPDPDADNLLYPVLNPTHFPSGMIWILKDDAFYAILDDGTETPAGVSVLMMPNGTSGARIISIEEDNSEATGISDATRLNDKGEMINDHWYTLDGRKLDVAPKTKGVYIHNGVKVVVK